MNFTLPGLIFLLIIAGICGAIGKAIAGGSHGGCLVSIALGFIGALVGPWIAQRIGLAEPFILRIAGYSFPVLWSIIGATLFVALVHLVSPRDQMRD